MAVVRVLLFRLASWLAYGALVPWYEWVARLYSDGEWHHWRQQGLGPVDGMIQTAARTVRVLEVGCGTGALLMELVRRPCDVIGLDRSPAMLAAAQHRTGGTVKLLQGRSQALPLAAGVVDAIILTFPTHYAYAADTWHEFARVLAAGGQVVWVDAGELRAPSLAARTLQTLLLPSAALVGYVDRITQRLTDLGFAVTSQTIELPRSRVQVLVARPVSSSGRPG